MAPKTKQCRRKTCLKTKPITDFPSDAREKDGHSVWCKSCWSKYQAARKLAKAGGKVAKTSASSKTAKPAGKPVKTVAKSKTSVKAPAKSPAPAKKVKSIGKPDTTEVG
jgi:hypothetical protein